MFARLLFVSAGLALLPPATLLAQKPAPTKDKSDREKAHAELLGQPAPEVEAAFSLNGENKKLSDLKGKVVLLDFWAVWCGPCIKTFPHLKEWNARYKGKGLEIVGLTSYYKKYDFKGGKLAAAKEPLTEKQEQAMLKAFASHHQLKHRLAVLDDSARREVYSGYKVSGIPQMVLIDREGVIRMIKVGSSDGNAKAVEAEIKNLLANTN